jgi:hypothetical protein
MLVLYISHHHVRYIHPASRLHITKCFNARASVDWTNLDAARQPELHNAPRRTMPTLRGEVKPELDDDNPYVTSSSHSRASRSTSLAPRDALEPPLTTTAAGGCAPGAFSSRAASWRRFPCTLTTSRAMVTVKS